MAIAGLDSSIQTITSGWGNLGKYAPYAAVFIGILVIATIIFLWAYWKKSRGRWNVLFRIRQENKQHGTLYLDPVEIKGKRVVLSNGLRLIFLEKEILGKRLFPNLNHYTRPGVYDLIITADNRIFLIDGIKGIDEERKELKVGIRYPGIDYSLEEVNRDHAKLNKLDRKSDLLGIVKAASIAVVAICFLIALIIGGKYWIEGKQINKETSQAELELFQQIRDYQTIQAESTNGMVLLINQLKQIYGTDNLRNELNKIREATNETV